MKMRKILGVALAVFLLLAQAVWAEDETKKEMQLSAQVRYDTNEIVLTCQSPAEYHQIIMAYLYQEEDPQPTNYLRIGEGETDENAQAQISLPIGEDLATGAYTIKVVGSGLMAADSVAEQTIELISLEDIDEIVKQINGASAAEVEPLVKQLEASLGLVFDEYYEENKEEYLDLFIKGRTQDNEGAFTDAQKVKLSWENTRILLQMKEISAAQSMQEFLSENGASLGFSLDNADYTANPQKVCEALISNIKSNGVESVTMANERFQEALGVGTINATSVEDLEEVLKRYADVLGYEDSMSDYDDLDNDEKIKVNRQLNGKNFSLPENVKKAVEDAIAYVKNNSNTGGGNGGNGGTGGGSGSGNRGNSGNTTTTIVTDYNPARPQTGEVFSDLDQQPWAKESILALVDQDIINGYSDGTFRGDNNVTREEFIKMMVTAFDVYDAGATCAFSDVEEGAWYYPYVASAAESGLAYGKEDGTFGCGENITRQDMAVIVYRASVNAGIVAEDAVGNGFTDADQIAQYAVQAVTALQGAGIIDGFEDGSFAPNQSLTRAEAAKVIYGLIQKK